MDETNDRKRVLLVTRNFPPLWGGMERLNWQIAAELKQRCSVRLVGPKGALVARSQNGLDVQEVALKPLALFLLSSLIVAVRTARVWRPDVIIAGSGLTAPAVWLAARICGARCVAYVHGRDIAVNNQAYQILWFPFLRRLDTVIANSRATSQFAKDIGISANRLRIVFPGVEMPAFDSKKKHSARLAFGLERSGPILLSVGRLTRRKGLVEFVQFSLPKIAEVYPDCVLVVVGETPTESLFAHTISQRDILAIAQSKGVEKNIAFLGRQSGESLSAAFFAADLHVFPVKEIKGDPEGFGMVAVEAAAHGLPTVAFSTGGVPDAVESNSSGQLVRSGDYAAFANAIIDMLGARRGAFSVDRCRSFAERFTWEHFGESFWGIIEHL